MLGGHGAELSCCAAQGKVDQHRCCPRTLEQPERPWNSHPTDTVSLPRKATAFRYV